MKHDGSGYFLNINDFAVGSDLVVFGKNIRIYDCDEYTREFYEVKKIMKMKINEILITYNFFKKRI